MRLICIFSIFHRFLILRRVVFRFDQGKYFFLARLVLPKRIRFKIATTFVSDWTRTPPLNHPLLQFTTFEGLIIWCYLVLFIFGENLLLISCSILGQLFLKENQVVSLYGQRFIYGRRRPLILKSMIVWFFVRLSIKYYYIFSLKLSIIIILWISLLCPVILLRICQFGLIFKIQRTLLDGRGLLVESIWILINKDKTIILVDLHLQISIVNSTLLPFKLTNSTITLSIIHILILISCRHYMMIVSSYLTTQNISPHLTLATCLSSIHLGLI